MSFEMKPAHTRAAEMPLKRNCRRDESTTRKEHLDKRKRGSAWQACMRTLQLYATSDGCGEKTTRRMASEVSE